MDKPIQLLLEDAKVDLTNKIQEVIDTYNLDYYFLYMILQEFLGKLEKDKNEQLVDYSRNYIARRKKENELDGDELSAEN